MPKLKCVPKKTGITPEGWTVWKCARGCGFGDTDQHNHFPDRIFPPPCRIQKRGLGDFVAARLDQLGITKERWARFALAAKHWPEVPAVYLEYKSPGCGCTLRQVALNQWGWMWQNRLNRVGARLMFWRT